MTYWIHTLRKQNKTYAASRTHNYKNVNYLD